MIFKQQFYNAGNYARLSDEDDRDGESGSIDSQRKIMQQFCEANSFVVADFYADDGYSGTNFDRPNFQRMILDIKQGKVNLVIVKDLSRFARNAGGAAYYVDMFEEYNVRFIAIDDGVDTLRGDDIVLPLKNVVNELYAKDISKKTRSALNARAKSGQYLSSRPAYGYMKDPTDHNHLLIDPESAEVVRTIFTMASTTYGYNTIVKHLTRQKILTPQSYFAAHNPDYFKKKPFTPHCQWNNKSVQVILQNPIYLGSLVYGKTRSKKIRSKDRSARPEEEWIVTEGTHEAIISQQLWDLAHERLNSRKREGTCGEVHMLAGYIFCADCGAAMTFNNRDFGNGRHGEFLCGTYKRKGKEHCSTHYVTYDGVYQMLLQDVRSKARAAQQNEARFMRSLEQESQHLAVRKSATLLKDEQQARQRVAQLDQIISKLYEDSALGVIPVERFQMMYMKYETEQKDLRAKLEAVDALQHQQEEQAGRLQAFTGFIREITDVEVLTPTILSRLVKRISVGQAAANPVTGEKEQAIRIEFAVA